MKRILLLGATGRLGQVLVEHLLKKQYQVTALVRSPQKLSSKTNLTILSGDVTSQEDLEHALKDVDVVISTLGHGFRTKYPIQKLMLEALIPLLEKKKIRRFITITGSGMLTKEDPKSVFAEGMEGLISLIDPYRMQDSKDQQKLLEKSDLEWTVVRTPIHNGSIQEKVTYVGLAQPPVWETVSRTAIAEFITECIEKDEWVRKSPIIY